MRVLVLVGAAVAVAASCGDPAAPVAEPPLRFDPDSVRLRLGEIHRLTLRTRNNGPLLYLSVWVDGPDAVSVDGVAVVRTKHPGVTTIRAYAEADGEGANATAAIAVLGVQVDPLETLPVRTRALLSWRVYDGFRPNYDAVVRWQSSDPTVATVSNDGVVTGVAPGSATLTVMVVADTTIRGTTPIVVR